MRKNIKMNGTQLKYIGAILMVFDHIHQMFYYVGIPQWFTMLGRVVFPIFFLVAEGYHYTSDKQKYMLQLLSGFWFMRIVTPLFEGIFPLEGVFISNNIFGTLFLSVILMYANYVI